MKIPGQQVFSDLINQAEPLVTTKKRQIQEPGIARVFAIMAKSKASRRRSSTPVGRM